MNDKICDMEGLDLQVIDAEEGFDISWNKEHPIALILGMNDWTPEEWGEFLLKSARAVLDEHGDEEGTRV